MLGKVEVRQLVQGIPIAITVLVRSPVGWSQDNNIAVVTQLGTYIFELTLASEECSPGVMFSRSFIDPPGGINPHLDTGIDVSRMLPQATHRMSHSLMLDGILSSSQRASVELDPRTSRTMSPAMPGGETNHLGYRKGVWSPSGIGERGRCVICLVTHDHQILIYGIEGRRWKKVVDLSAEWYKHVSHNSWDMIPVSSVNSLLDKHTARVQMLSVSELIWTPLYEHETGAHSVLIMFTTSGHAVFWRIEVNLQSVKSVHLIGIKDTKMNLISAIHWYAIEKERAGYLVIGSSRGQVKIFYCKFDDEDISMHGLGYAYLSEDRLQVTQIHLARVEDRYLLLLGKHNIFIASLLHLKPDNLTLGQTTHLQIGKLAITGIIYVENKSIYLSLKDGVVQQVSVNITNDDSIYIENVGPTFSSDGVAYTGLVISPNGSLWGILESVSVAYDHLMVREPTQLSIYQVGEHSNIVQHLFRSTASPHENADLLESLRLYTCKTGTAPADVRDLCNIDQQSISSIKIKYWLIKMCRTMFSNNKEDLEYLAEGEHKLQTLIIERWIVQTMKKLSQEEFHFEEENVRKSVQLMCEWTKNHGNEEEKSMAESVSSKLGSITTEQCLVCKDDVRLVSLTYGRCNKGHSVPRCCRTLLLTKPTMKCRHCISFAHISASLLEERITPTCVYCDGFMADEIGGGRRTQKT